MSDIRKPDYTIFACNGSNGKVNKLEIFSARQFFTEEEWNQFKYIRKAYQNKYRLRVNGRWFPKIEDRKSRYKFFWKTEIRDLFWNSAKHGF